MKQLLSIVMAYVCAICISYAQPQPPKKPNDADRLKHVTEKLEKELQLTATQKEKVTAAYKTFFADIDKNRTDNGKAADAPPPPPPPPPVKKEVVEKLLSQRDEAIKKVLTEEQYKKYITIEKKMRPGKHAMPHEPKAPKP
ncbi:MAG: hypothetical protein ACOVNY_09635, partial [Chitinophagaceae bacterium]